jgi:hypothetical protein
MFNPSVSESYELSGVPLRAKQLRSAASCVEQTSDREAQ